MAFSASHANTSKHLPKVLFIVGATSSGKTTLSIDLAKQFHGEVINADARQIYRGFTIGTGKPAGSWEKHDGRLIYTYEGIPHHIMDAVSPQETYSVSVWRDIALREIEEITHREQLPIVVGGTGLYISSIVDHLQFPHAEPDAELRAQYEGMSLEELIAKLQNIDPDALSIVDLKNKRRVIRALEITECSGSLFSQTRKKGPPLVDALQIGIDHNLADLYARADATVDKMMEQGFVHEVKTLLKNGVQLSDPAMSSLGYIDIAKHLSGECTLEEVVDTIKKKTHAYIRRQRTWFKKDQRIVWIKEIAQADQIIHEWLAK